MKMYPGYKAGLNSRGLASNKNEDPKPTTERGKRRVQRRAEGKTNAGAHKHEYKLWDVDRMSITKGQHYSNPGRADNERLFRCERTNKGRRRGGGQRCGCGATSRTGK